MANFNMALKPKRIIFYCLLAIWLAVWFFIGFCIWNDSSGQIARDKKFIENKINPHIALVNSFRVKYNRLPTVKEFNYINGTSVNDLADTDYIRDDKSVPDEIRSRVKNWSWTNNYVIAVWRGEWWEYYLSKNNTYITNRYSKTDALIGLLVCMGIGISPLVLNVFFRRTRLYAYFVSKSATFGCL
ncbi:hypothetical protein KHS38_07020 [Mucilaginibacter sp. Bleaf8]|uniref:hypothetical protein n=1 Tax=Mucilaginibacter sp. Bleaf8 TaxID=2834430 RepID=UPI001BCECFF1|nr:hypothetical protein [Mucilaginibacter sp. Bleaf8]MBS7564152.1 hypothetical protein [Mucilaginibacter sp. Bleaf8]